MSRAEIGNIAAYAGKARPMKIAVAMLPLLWLGTAAAAPTCDTKGVHVQVLGSGGPELHGGRAASGNLVWIEGKPRVLVDIGGGAALRFAEAGAEVADLDVILLTNLRADRTADLPALVAASVFENRARPLPLYGPEGDRLMPSTVTFVRALFDNTRGAYRHLGDFLSPLAKTAYKLQPYDVRERPVKIGAPRKRSEEVQVQAVFANDALRVSAVPVTNGAVPGLAFRVEAGGKSVVFSGDGGADAALERLAHGADILVAPHAAPDAAPADLGRLAGQAGVKQLTLVHRMRATSGKEDEMLTAIRKGFAGPVTFADDLDCLDP
ncbi:MAG: hypothetical protein A2637_07705 [Candidatus Muproteobacteria bacterium RIFCSPHIGHO2_01_FULL_65_16]|uniref:Metallo-beta-lactamase domain-containing protein n=1 Tax=Candidatus Muproteobacteria bacterium RIFCSPHIGHO2_01_FULL_65_16 TaxID=1817764 RepID=A0A1F6TIB4_9PROT|nr:MAG: hypothetical protein A2637_07705 [Candidatus Muproteobacteria bacterium RIFCSPHIGHO2_01_FULL_65_16]